MLSGDRAADRHSNLMTLDDASANNVDVQVKSVAKASPMLVRNPMSPQGPPSQILTIDDGGAVSAAVSNPPRATSFLQRLLSACSCGSRQGKSCAHM
jgi:hypothetical protein